MKRDHTFHYAWILSALFHLSILGIVLVFSLSSPSPARESIAARRGISARFLATGHSSNQPIQKPQPNRENRGATEKKRERGIDTKEINRLLRTIDYPPLARQMKMEGRTVVECEINPDGTPSRCGTAESSGYDLLDQAAVDGVMAWTFPSATESESLRIPVRFQLMAKKEGEDHRP